MRTFIALDLPPGFADDAAALARELAENHQELVRPFMLMRASTLGADAPVSAMDISSLNLGAYL